MAAQVGGATMKYATSPVGRVAVNLRRSKREDIVSVVWGIGRVGLGDIVLVDTLIWCG